MLLYLCLVGIGTIFLILLLAYARTEVNIMQKLQAGFPKFFSVSTVLILISSYTLMRVPRYYRKDNLHKMVRYLGFTLALGFAFCFRRLPAGTSLLQMVLFCEENPQDLIFT